MNVRIELLVVRDIPRSDFRCIRELDMASLFDEEDRLQGCRHFFEPKKLNLRDIEILVDDFFVFPMPFNELTVSFKDLYRRDDVVGHIFHKGLEPRVSPFDFIEHGIEGFDELSGFVFLPRHRNALAQILRSNLRHARRKRRDGAHHGIDEYCTATAKITA